MVAAKVTEQRRRRGLMAAELIVRFLASPAGTLSATVMGRIPGLWSKVFLKPVMPTLAPADVAALKSLIASCADSGRTLFSMALSYMDQDDAVSDAKALACLRSAEFVEFESSERIMLWRAVLAARSGAVEEAAALAHRLGPEDLSAGEQTRLESALASPGQRRLPVQEQPQLEKTPQSVLVLNDHDAKSAGWFSSSRYLWVSSEGNGLTLSWASGLQTSFEVICGPLQLKEEAEAAGVRYTHWVETT